ncbi:lipid-A-disaccharide synthase [Pseudooceanicola sediminis]|uniref:Lipid-A-disaccharide synthase n=1 Tax=Pseudooceanicola sediminis TaxID=2211117 RepID=A0A399J9H1_9RHOB|nr:lipid-A-disaccharide synthase [Pseudooceanicola sediminis]KAA2316874.1 lipid-A-disaccharide synthase [Puniceibacterium sp. HSS470]RII40672.1 lipid-A-disaccharide synthase [Pseudooceanicola sediminis]|tara:strand:- start:127718 stop:128869 length:1152 start_codon:yes stop_codon:yes gene_type:complete
MRIFVIAGEPSGDSLGAAVMAGLRALVPDIRFDGVGGAKMQAEGLTSRFPMDELSVMGLAEIAPKYFHLKRRIRECADAVLADPPDLLLTIDSPDFCLRVAGLVKQRSDIRTVHYVAPTVWAWRPKRAEKMARVIDHVLALFPFEPPYMQRAGMACDFVGHPVVTEPVATTEEVASFRARHGIGEAPLLLVLPGSRRGEVAKLGPIFSDVLARAKAAHPDLRLVLPAADHVAQTVQDMVATWPVPPIVLDPRGVDRTTFAAEKRAAFKAADVALAASGTVSLELAAAATPMVIAYDMHWLTRRIIQRMLLTDTVTLVNLVSDTRTIPEFIADDCRAELIAPAITGVLETPQAQLSAMALTMDRLGKTGEAPGLRAARAILDRL